MEEPTSEPLEAGEAALVDMVRKAFYDKSPMELEALTTIDYVANTLLSGKAVREAVIKQVQVIKGKKFSREYLEKEYDVLIEQGYLSA